MTLKPTQTAPQLVVDTLEHGTFDLSAQNPENFTLVVFNRGVHCPVCKMQVRDLDRHYDEFKAIGVHVISVSMDTQEAAQRQKDEWEIETLPIGYGMTEDKAREWGLFISEGSAGEPARFSEPGLFAISPDGTIYAEAVQSMPWARPTAKSILGGLQYSVENNAPVRGTV